MTCDEPRKQDRTSIYSNQVPIMVVLQAVARLLLEGDSKQVRQQIFIMIRIVLIHQYSWLSGTKHILLMPSLTTRLNKMKLDNDGYHPDITKSQKKMPTSSIEKIGVMNSVTCFSCIMVNLITCPPGIVDHKEMVRLGSPSVIRQVAH